MQAHLFASGRAAIVLGVALPLMVNGVPLPSAVSTSIHTSLSFPYTTSPSAITSSLSSSSSSSSSSSAPASLVATSIGSMPPVTRTVPDGSAVTLPPTMVAAEDSSASATPTILAFHVVDSFAGIAAQYANQEPSSNGQSDSQYWLSYDNPWSTSDTSLAVSLPNVTVSGTPATGVSAQAFAQVPGQGQGRSGTASLTYRVYFPDSFNFELDAHLPSIYSGRLGCGSCFSSRVRYTANGQGEVYMYTPSVRQSAALCNTAPTSACDSYGNHIGQGSFQFSRNKWISIRQDLWLNTPGQADGGFSIWIDGALVLTANNVRYTYTAQRCPLQTMGFSNARDELYDRCAPPSSERWSYRPIIRKRPKPRPVPVQTRLVTVVQPTTVVRPTTVIAPITVDRPITKVIIQPTMVPVTKFVTHTDAVTVPTTELVTVPTTETATVTVTETPEPTDPPPEELPIVEPPADDAPGEDEPEDEESITARDPRNVQDRRLGERAPDDGMWKGINGYPGDPGYKGAPAPVPAGPGMPYTISLTQVVTLPGAVQTVTVTQTKTTTVAAKPTPPAKKPAPKKKQ